MSKRLKIALICLLCIILLSACQVPFTDKQLTIPLLEDKPEAVLAKMYDAMGSVKTYTQKTDNEISVYFDPASITNGPLSFLNRSEPFVLGIDNYSQEAVAEKKLSQVAAMPMLGSGPMKIKYKISAEGSVDQTDEENPKSSMQTKLRLDFGGMEIKLDLDTVLSDERIYLRIDQVPFPLSMMIGNEVSNKWWYIDNEELKAEQERLKKETGNDIVDQINMLEDKEKLERIETELLYILKENKLIKFNERLADEKINNHSAYHYKVSLNRENLNKAFQDIYNLINREFETEKPSMLYGWQDDPKFSELVGKFANAISKADAELWIGKKDFYLYKTKYNMDFDINRLEIDDMPANLDMTVSLAGSIEMDKFNEKIDIHAPTDSKSIMRFIEEAFIKPMEEARMRSRDAKRISDIRQMQTLLEMHEFEHDSYPEKPETNVDGETVVFSEVFQSPESTSPECPGNFGYQYQVENEGKDYRIDYCLEAGTGNIPAGYNTATAQYISQAEIERLKSTDSDFDGLFDWDEINKYNTDRFNADSDGDGYLDGEEVENGFNPNGEGKLIR